MIKRQHVSDTELEGRIHGFMIRKDAEFPILSLLVRDETKTVKNPFHHLIKQIP